MSSAKLAAGDGAADSKKPKKSKGFFHSVTSYASKAVGTVHNGISSGISSVFNIGNEDVEVTAPDGGEGDAASEAGKGRFKKEEQSQLWTMMHKYIGADVTSLVTLPVFLFEPMTTLQKMAELMEYTDLLNRAAVEKDPYVKLALSVGWALSPYYAYQRTWKPFNPILGETYELTGYNNIDYIAEQVTHHPPMGVAHAEHPLWTYDCISKLKTKFMGNYLDVTPLGQTRVRFRETGEVLDLVPPMTKVHNLIVGRTWVDSYGDMVLTNMTTNDVCVLNFKACGWFGSGRHEVSGYVENAAGEKKLYIWGKWTKAVWYKACTPDGEPIEGAEEVLIWKLAEVPKNDKYDYTYFAHMLNSFETAPKPVLASDGRIRGDRLALERGNTKKAGSDKTKLEERQRYERREREARGEEWTPRWFRPTGEAACEGELPIFEFTGAYSERVAAIKSGQLKDGIVLTEEEDPSDKYSPWQYKAPEEVELLGASNPDHNLSSSSLTESLKPVDSGKSDSVQSGGVVKPVVKPGLIDPAVIDAAISK
eukprot:TRINITY_DN16775_c0_g1_i1.p1 TRINITY_DN16775_c0_g1~~TRINITY_DN16775_c0_g1_i1.p1  ORF type:complete len:536 (-),score=173.66 TRINITY_DN16775_c0_g1_i1:232-1839(-)